MRVSFSLLFAVILSLDAFAAPVPDANDFALEVRKAAKVAAKKAPVKAKAPAIKAKPVPKKVVAPKPAKPAVAPKPVAKKPTTAVAKKPVTKAPVAKKPVVKPTAQKVTTPDKKPAAKAPIAKTAAKPAANPPVKPAAKKGTTPAKKPAPLAKTPAKVTTPAAKTSAEPVAKGKTAPAKAPAAKVPTSCAVRPKSAVKPVVPRADFEVLDSRGKKRPRPQPISACGVVIRDDNVRALCEKQKVVFQFANGALDPKKLTRRTLSDVSDSEAITRRNLSDISDSEEEDSDDAEDEEDDSSSSGSDDSQDGDFSPSPSPPPVARNQCDHVLELQVLKKTLEAPGGVCATLKAMIASPNSGLTTADTTSLMKPIIDAINGKSNLFFLDRKLNQVKRDEVTASLKGQAPKTSSKDLKEQRVAVDEYLTDTSVNGPSLTLAKKLDSLAAAMLTKAETQALAHIKSCAVTTAAADEKALKAAKATLKTSPTVTSAWNNVLNHVAAQAKI
ncbi:hypothetical protein C8F04DRAFT_1118736 [Mycena alexandri]|uniref:Uncharacterized protein n=1 Tax=Mycena alexandri TaxID=1745969 RepID=A0AAD6SJC8_9AGAR|nr:hypothetical protein C8F04DRAFT_1118736 [Mycena alexandri]